GFGTTPSKRPRRRMSKSVDPTRPSHAGTEESQTRCRGTADHPKELPTDLATNKPARRDEIGVRHLLDRILNTPGLEQVVPRLKPDILHRVIQTCGLEDCGELVALATSEQLARIFDLDLWRASRPGMDEQFDPDRFGLWIEVLGESGVDGAAEKLAWMDVDLVVAGLSRHVLVHDRAAVTPYETLDGEQIEVNSVGEDRLTFDLGGYLLVARRADSWHSIIDVLLALGEGHSNYFGRLMDGCRTLSNSGHELDGLDDLLADEDQARFDLAVDREGRREKQGYVTPAQARAFLQMAREARLSSKATPPLAPTANPIVQAYFQALNEGTHEQPGEGLDEKPADDVDSKSGPLAMGSDATPASEDIAAASAAVHDILNEAGLLQQAPRGLVGGQEGHASRLSLIRAQMQLVLDHGQMTYSARSEELAYLANTLMAGCGIQERSFTAQEASDAAVAVCNLGLENWPPHWLPANETSLPGSFLWYHDLIGVFQVGWSVLHTSVGMYAAEQLIEVLTRMRCDDPEIQAWLDALRSRMAKHWRARTPWRARNALEVIATLDTPAWAVLLGLIDECPVLHPFASSSKNNGNRSVSTYDFEFISENSQIAAVREFLRSLPERLRTCEKFASNVAQTVSLRPPGG
ncbi:MAG: DUF6178 family protein, partial [Blastocatellia bacterium]